MIRLLTCLLLLVFTAGAVPEVPLSAAGQGDPDQVLTDAGLEDIRPEVMNDKTAVSDELIVLVDQGTNNSEIREMAEDAGASVKKVNTLCDGTKMARVVTDNDTARDTAQALQEEKKVLIVQPNYLYRLNDDVPKNLISLKDRQWHLGPASSGGIDALAAWNLLSAGNNNRVTVAVIDTGVLPDHPDLAGRIDQTKCRTINKGTIYEDFKARDNSDDDNGHGTHVCGIIAAAGHAGSIYSVTGEVAAEGTAGVAADRARIICIDAEDPDTESFSTLDVCTSINYALSQQARIINLSLGGLYRDLVMETCIREAWDKGAVCVCAAG